MDNVTAIVLIVVGLALILFRKKFIRDSLAFQNKTFGFHLGKKDADVGAWFVPVFGFLLISVGGLALLGVF